MDPDTWASPGTGTSDSPMRLPIGTPLTTRRSLEPWFAWTSTPSVYSRPGRRSLREDVPTPPLKPWQIMPVPPPTLPSGTGPSVAFAIASATCSGRTCVPNPSLRCPSQVSPTTGRIPPSSSSRDAPRAAHLTSPSYTAPTLRVDVSAMGDRSIPDSRSQCIPVTSPQPLRTWNPADSGSLHGSPGCGRITVTPVRTGPRPTTSSPSPSISVTCPTLTPGTSVMQSRCPGTPSPTTRPVSRKRGIFTPAVAWWPVGGP